jgi:hypothetical protein
MASVTLVSWAFHDEAQLFHVNHKAQTIVWQPGISTSHQATDPFNQFGGSGIRHIDLNLRGPRINHRPGGTHAVFQPTTQRVVVIHRV